jgi:hypothetical protein
MFSIEFFLIIEMDCFEVGDEVDDEGERGVVVVCCVVVDVVDVEVVEVVDVVDLVATVEVEEEADVGNGLDKEIFHADDEVVGTID